VIDSRGIITSHFITHWGVPSDIRPRNVRGTESFAILEFPPRVARKTWRYATNGMSSIVQTSPSDGPKIRTELYTCTSTRLPWIDELLAAIASYPYDYSTYLAQSDTIEVGQPIDRNRSSYTGILLAPPDPPTLGLVAGISDNVLVHQVIGLFPNELEFAKREGGERLWDKVSPKGEFLLDLDRLPFL
jgi:hypothetical protein